MTTQEYIEKKLIQYSEAFDHYMEFREMPAEFPEEDCLGGYIRVVIEDNPQLDGSDYVWVEVLKNYVMEFMETMLKAFMPLKLAFQKEQEMIREYEEGDIEKKRDMWGDVRDQIRQNYQPSQINLDGYIQQFGSNDRDVVFSALINDWRKGSLENLINSERKILDQNRRRFEKTVKEWGRDDYEAIRKVEKTFFKYPALEEIVHAIGREKKSGNMDMDDIVYRYMPILPSIHQSHTDVEQVSLGNNLNHLVPCEMAILSDTDIEILFYQRYASCQLQTFSNKPLLLGQKKDIQRKKKHERLSEGPIIVAVDTSGSMCGRRTTVANSLIMQIVRMAKKKHRDCFLILFSVRAMTLNITQSVGWNKVEQFLERYFLGGTDGEEMLKNAVEALQTKEYSMADVLIISDFDFSPPSPTTKERILAEKAKGTKFYGLSVSEKIKYDALDKIWNVNIKGEL